jgi:putative transposase
MKKHHVTLSSEDKFKLSELSSKGKHRPIVFKRIMALQKLDEGATFMKVKTELGVSYPAVLRWAASYEESGLEFLVDKPRPGRPLKFDGEDRAKITALACSESPEGYARWNLRLLAHKLVELELVSEISHTEVGKILKKTNSSRTGNANGALVN